MPPVGFYLVTKHTAHVRGALPYLLVAACPLMHVFMHHGHHHGGQHRTNPGVAAMNHPCNDSGLWGLVVIDSVVFVGFACSFFKPVEVPQATGMKSSGQPDAAFMAPG